jgi:hypothetical protein
MASLFFASGLFIRFLIIVAAMRKLQINQKTFLSTA